MRILANENIPAPSLKRVRAAGKAMDAIIEDSPGASDYTVLARAASERLVIWTFDRDYGDLIYRQRLPTPAGVIYMRFNPATPEEPAEILLQLLSMAGIILEGMFTVVERGGFRQRALP